MPEERHVEMRVSESPVCDFCSSEEPRYQEPCADFETDRGSISTLGGPYVANSISAWASCEVCHQLIAQGKWHTLARRATDALCRKHPNAPRSYIAQGVEHMHNGFRQHRLPPS